MYTTCIYLLLSSVLCRLSADSIWSSSDGMCLVWSFNDNSVSSLLALVVFTVVTTVELLLALVVITAPSIIAIPSLVVVTVPSLLAPVVVVVTGESVSVFTVSVGSWDAILYSSDEMCFKKSKQK